MNWTKTLSLALVATIGLGAGSAAGIDRPATSMLSASLLQYAEAIPLDGTKQEKRRRKAIEKAVRKIEKSGGTLLQDIRKYGGLGEVLRASHDSPEEVQMQLLIFGVMARTSDDADAQYDAARAEIDAGDLELSPRLARKIGKWMDKSSTKLGEARRIIGDTLGGFRKHDDVRAAFKRAAKGLDKGTAPIARVQRQLDKARAPADPPTLPALTGNQFASMSVPVAGRFDDTDIVHFTHGRIRQDGTGAWIELAALATSGEGRYLRIALGAAAASPGFAFQDGYDGAALGDLAVSSFVSRTYPHNDGLTLAVQARAARGGGHLGIISMEQEAVEARGTVTVPSQFPGVPDIVITFNLLLPAVQ